jgi:hypothetical protein
VGVWGAGQGIWHMVLGRATAVRPYVPLVFSEPAERLACAVFRVSPIVAAVNAPPGAAAVSTQDRFLVIDTAPSVSRALERRV